MSRGAVLLAAALAAALCAPGPSAQERARESAPREGAPRGEAADASAGLARLAASVRPAPLRLPTRVRVRPIPPVRPPAALAGALSLPVADGPPDPRRWRGGDG